MDNAKKHSDKLKKYMNQYLGNERTGEILQGLKDLTGEETPAQCADWAYEVNDRLEKNIDPELLINIRQECACIKANKYSPYVKYFKAIREKHEDDNEYLKEVAEFLNGRGRCGKKVELVGGKIFSHYGFGTTCVCYPIKGGWDKPPSTTWCRCCQGTLLSIYKLVFPEKKCNMDIVETFASGGSDCVFITWYTE
ncbi:MAG: hypothetical protein K0R54_4874 [Clostridiaceae bacterium]|jgi:hypothetical protein|nr:hypothetical protein [Clostridiaceae bacterium]